MKPDSQDEQGTPRSDGLPADPAPSPAAARAGRPCSAEEVQAWIVNYLAAAQNVSPEEIDISVPFATLAVDSVTAISMTGELEEWLGCKIDPMVVYDYPTIEAIAEHLAKTGASSDPSA